MARRKYPFYRPVSHRIKDDIDRGLSRFVENIGILIFQLFGWWVAAYAALFVLAYMSDELEMVPTFSEYASGTWDDILHPILVGTGQVIGDLFDHAKGGTP